MHSYMIMMLYIPAKSTERVLDDEEPVHCIKTLRSASDAVVASMEVKLLYSLETRVKLNTN